MSVTITPADAAGAPFFDDDGLLRFDHRWVDVPAAQVPIVELLIARPGRLIDFEAIRRTYMAHGGTSNPSTLRKVIGRVRTRLARVGLRLHVVRGLGAILEVPEPPS